MSVEPTSFSKPQAAAELDPKIVALADFLVKYRWIFVVPIVLPLSKAFDIYWAIRNFYERTLRSAANQHDARVAEIQRQVSEWRTSGASGLLCSARKGWQTISQRVSPYKKQNHPIRIELFDILEIDTESRIVRCEPGVNMGQLTSKLNPMGWTLPIVPELDDLTVGGLIVGFGIEGSSHKYGLFADLVESYEVVLGNGEVIRATREENADLFHALPWSYGALGFITAVELRIIPCKPYVHLTYYPTHSLEQACALFEEFSYHPNPPEFVEGILFSKDKGVIMTAKFADKPADGRVNAIGRYYKPWFYKHVESFLERGSGEEYLPLRDYYHRHTKSIFWEGELIIPFGNHPVFRYLLGWLMPPKIAFLKLTQGESIRRYYEDKHIAQDSLLPLAHLKKTIEFLEETFDGYPIWLCPHKTLKTEPQGMMQPKAGTTDYEMYVDVGTYYAPGPVMRKEPFDVRSALRKLERFLRDHRGYQALYAITEMTRQEYREMFDCTLYDAVRKKYHAEGVFLDAYDRVKRQ